MLDQIRANGEKKELVDEVVALAKKYGITTPYTSWLIVPDAAVPVAHAGKASGHGKPNVSFNGGSAGIPAAALNGPKGTQLKVKDFAQQQASQAPTSGFGGFGGGRMNWEYDRYKNAAKDGKADKDELKALNDAQIRLETYNQVNAALSRRQQDLVQAGKLGVDMSLQMQNLRSQSKLDMTALRNVQGRNVLEFGGVWIDEGYNAKTKMVVVKAMSEAYFRILERHDVVKDVYRLGNHLVWITPSGTALVVDCTDGNEKLSDEEIDKLFVAAKK
jgi:Ca-activated chloride channel family protein